MGRFACATKSLSLCSGRICPGHRGRLTGCISGRSPCNVRNLWTGLSLAALTVMFGSAFMLIKLAVQELPPFDSGHCQNRGGSHPVAWDCTASKSILRLPAPRPGCWSFPLPYLETAFHSTLISWGQQKIDSSVAGNIDGGDARWLRSCWHVTLCRGKSSSRCRCLGFYRALAGFWCYWGPAAIAEFGNSCPGVFPDAGSSRRGVVLCSQHDYCQASA